MKQALLFSILFISSVISSAQDTATLSAYLVQHRYTIDLSSPHAFDMLPGMMKEKKFLILGEGGSHQLELYNTLKPALLDQLATQNLKYYFIELGRSTATILDKYLHGIYPSCSSAFTGYCSMMDHEKATLKKGHEYKLVGIDFEIRIDLYTNIHALFKPADLEKTPVSKVYLADLMDSTVLKMTHKEFMKFYKAKRKEFYANKQAIKEELGDKYAELEYLVTNTNTTRPNIDRNPAMTRNLLREITPVDTSATYLLTIGMAHSIPSEHYSVAHKLSKSDQLKNKLLVMNLYCENCTVDGKKLDGYSMLKFLHDDDITACFSRSANADLVLFDLSQLPPEYDYIKKGGDLLLFVRNQH